MSNYLLAAFVERNCMSATIRLVLSPLLFANPFSEDLADLGKLMLLGFISAVVVAIAFTLVRLRLRENKVTDNSLLSINTRRDDVTKN